MISGFSIILDKAEDIHTTKCGNQYVLSVENCFEGNKPLMIMFNDESLDEFINDIYRLRANDSSDH